MSEPRLSDETELQARALLSRLSAKDITTLSDLDLLEMREGILHFGTPEQISYVERYIGSGFNKNTPVYIP